MVGLGRLERPTSPLSGVRSNHLSYRPSHPAKPDPTPIKDQDDQRSARSRAGRASGKKEKRGRRSLAKQDLTKVPMFQENQENNLAIVAEGSSLERR